MGKKNISVCTICGKEDCDGRIFLVKAPGDGYHFEVNRRVCSSDEHLNKEKMEYRIVAGHGDTNTVKVIEVNE